MNSPNIFTRFVADIKFKRMYTCMTCNVEQEGDTEQIAIDRHFPDMFDIAISLRSLPLKAHAMPVGWASYLEGIRCPKCVV